MATEARDDARSTQLAQVLDLWSEGPITGLVNGLKSVYLDKVPIENADGTRNFDNVQFDWVRGTQDQAALPGITAVQNEVSVGITVLAATPVVRSISTVGVDTVRVTIATGQLTTTNPDNGDLNGASFDYAIDVKSGGGAWTERFTGTVRAKVTTVYRRAVMVQLQGAGPWEIRVRRLTPDSTSQLLQNAFTWTSYTEIKTLKLRMPNSAVSALTVNAANFTRIPDRAFDVLGLEIEVPSNYDPITRVYTGPWDGTFKRAWTNNPAWVFYAMGTTSRWGLGRYVTAAQMNKWQLYTIGRFCDSQVPSGRKNLDGTAIMEPRFTIGLYMQTRGEARQVMQDLAALFRSIAFWAGGQLQTVQDAPSDPTMLFTPSNVADGLFQYQSSSDLQRHSVFIVYWNDLSQFGLRVPEVYVDEAAVTRYGIRELELSPIGTTSRGQAQRLARWAAYSEAMEGETVSFRVGADGALVLPGKVFGIADPSEAGDRMGGRIRSATTTAVTLDAPVELRAGEAYTLSVMLPGAPGPQGTPYYVTEERSVTTAAGAAVGVVSVFPAFSAAPAPEAAWLLQSDAVAATMWRCLGVVEVAGKDQYEISGVRHDPAKFDLIELGVRIDPRPISRVRLDSPPPTNLAATEAVVIDGPMPRSRVTFNWVPGSKGLTHQVSYSLAGGPRVTLPETAFQSVDISGLWQGELRLYVRSQNSIGNVSREVVLVITLLGKTAPAADVTGLASTVADTGLAIETAPYPQPDYAETELRRGVNWVAGIPLFGTTATRFSGTRFIWPRPAVGTYTVWAKWIDTTGHPSANAVSITVVVDTAAVLQWANIAGVPANLAGLTGSEAIRNADIIVGGYNLATRSNDFSLFNQVNAGITGPIVATGQPDHLGAANATRLTCTSGQPGGFDRYRHFTGLRPGVTYTASLWVKRETAGNFCLSPTNGLAWNTGTTGVVTATGWQRATAQVQAGSTGVVDVALGGHSNGAYPPQQPGNVLIAYFQLEEGNAATQWGAAPEDIAGLISDAQQAADAANTQLAAIASDNVLTKGEKTDVILDWSVVAGERPGIEAQANAYAIYGGVQSDYLNSLNALAGYLQSISGGWNNLTTDSPIDGSAFRSAWAALYTARQTLLNKISAVAGTLSTWGGTSGRPLDAYNMVFTPTFELGSAGAWEGTVVAVDGQPFTKAIQFTHRDNHEVQQIPVRGGETLYVYASIDASTSTTAVTFGIEAHKAGGALSTAAGPWIGALGVGPGTAGWVYGGQAITVPSDATHVLPWVQINGAGGVELPPARLTNLYIGRAQPGATLGAPAGTYVGSQLAQDLVATASNAQLVAGNAMSGANAANGRIQAIDSDGVLARGEKPELIKDWQAISDAYAGILASANAYGIVSERDAFTAAYGGLSNYLQSLSPAWNNTSQDTLIVPAIDKTAWANYYAARQALLNKIAEVAGTRAQYALVSGRPLLFRVAARGANDSAAPTNTGFFNGETGAVLGGAARSYVLVKLNRYSGAAEFGPQGYDVYGGGAQQAGLGAIQLAQQLMSATSSQIVVIYTFDEPATSRLSGGLAEAMYRCGASRAVFGSPQFRIRSAYILVGIGGCGEGNGYEAYSGSVDNDTTAWCDVAFQLASGQLIISGTSATPRTLADYSYTGDLDATRNRVYRQQADPGAMAANGDRWIQTDAGGNAIAVYDRVGGNWYTGPSGPQGSQGIQGPPGANGQSTYFHIAYASTADGSAGFNQTSGTYVGTYVDNTAADSGDYHRYTWRQFVGSQGPQGGQGIPGTTGPGGTPSYLHIKYSNDGGSTFTSSGGEDVGSWIGTYVDAAPADSASVGAYTWARLQPPNFRQEGDPGAVQDGATWTVPSTGKSYVRQGGAWVPYVGAGSVNTAEIAANAATEAQGSYVAAGGVGCNNSSVTKTENTASYTNTTPGAVPVQIEATTAGLVSWNASFPSVARSYCEWSSASSGSGTRVIVPEHANSAVTSVHSQGAFVAIISVAAGDTISAALKHQITHTAAASISTINNSLRLAAIKR